MDKIAKWSVKDRTQLFKEAAVRRGMVPAIIEKDFWVCWILGKLFSDEVIRKKIMFKGGTSLSKVFGLIQRFSEDIDLILHWDEVATEEPILKRTKKKQDEFNKSTRKAAQQYLKDTFVFEVQELVDVLCKATIHEDDPNIIVISYPTIFNEKYLRSEILLEIGPLAAWIPNSEYMITPYAAEEFPDQFSNPDCKVCAIKAERTFWEKVTILHQEAHRAIDKMQHSRYSRHYYDLMKMSQSSIKETALKDIDLLNDVVEFKQRFYPCAWARYDLAKVGTLKLVPPVHVRNALEKDYRDMQVMIFGETPTFEEIIVSLERLEQEINELHK